MREIKELESSLYPRSVVHKWNPVGPGLTVCGVSPGPSAGRFGNFFHDPTDERLPVLCDACYPDDLA